MLQFFEVLRNYLNWAWKLIFWLTLRVFLFMLSYTIWDTHQDFAKWKPLLRWISVVRFISIAYVVVKLKFFQLFAWIRYPWYGSLWAFTPPQNIVWSCWKLWPSVVSDKKNSVFEKSFKILNFGSNGMQQKFTVLVHFGAQFTAGKPKILLKPKISAKTGSLGPILRSNLRPYLISIFNENYN